jgi:tetratricopeptide (TPR) repeat protein
MGNTLRKASSSLLAALALALASCRTTAPPPVTRVPDPAAPPLVGGALPAGQADAARAAVGEAERGNFAASERYLAEIPQGQPVRTLAALEVRYLRGEKVAQQALELAAREPGYGSAWGFAAEAARREGDLRHALDAARSAARLQPDAGWTRVAEEIERAWVESTLDRGSELLRQGDASQALERAHEVLGVDAEAAGARLLAVRALLALHDSRGAAELVPGLPDTPEGLELKGAVAEARGQLDLAVELYSRLPASDARRCELLAAARRRWRLANAPPYLTKALAARSLDRRGLAAIVAFEVPAVAHRASGPVPVFEDVVQLPERGDIVAVARAGVITGDPVTHRFGPDRTVSPDELAGALDRLAAVLGRPKPEWCNGETRGCLKMPVAVNGSSAAALVLDIAGGGGEPCAQR